MTAVSDLPRDPGALDAAAAAGAVRLSVPKGGRIPAVLLAAAKAKPGAFTFEQPDDALVALLRHIGLSTAFGIEPGSRPSIGDDPYAVVANRDGTLRIACTPSAGRILDERWDTAWIARIEAASIVLDCSALDQANSQIIAWMLRLVQSARPTPVSVAGIKPQVKAQLKQLRLDRILTMA